MPWEDPSEWVIKTYPWSSPAGGGEADWPPLLRLRPEDVGYDSAQVASTSSANKMIPATNSGDSNETNDPLVSILTLS